MTFIFRYLIALFFLINSGFSVSALDADVSCFVDDREPIKIPREFEPCFKLMVEMDSFEGTLSDAITKMEPVRNLMISFAGDNSCSFGLCDGILLRYKDMLIEQEKRLKCAYNDVELAELLKEERDRDKKKLLNYYRVYSRVFILNGGIEKNTLGESPSSFWNHFRELLIDRYLIPDQTPSLFFNKYDQIISICRIWYFMNNLNRMKIYQKLFQEGGRYYQEGWTFKQYFSIWCFYCIRNCLVLRNSNNRYLPGLGMAVPPLELDPRLFPYSDDEINELAWKITMDSLESVRKSIAEIQYE